MCLSEIFVGILFLQRPIMEMGVPESYDWIEVGVEVNLGIGYSESS